MIIQTILVLIGLCLAFFAGVLWTEGRIRKQFLKFAAEQIEWANKKTHGYTQEILKDDPRKMKTWSRTQTTVTTWYLAYRYIVEITHTNKRRSKWKHRTALENK